LDYERRDYKGREAKVKQNIVVEE
jgi:hypothetical protein